MSKAGPGGVRLDKNAPLWLLAVALTTAAPHAEHQPLWLSLLSGGVMLWRLWLWRRDEPLPPRWLLMLVVIGGVAGIALQFRTLFGRDAGVALLVLFMALKPLEMRTRRDALVVVMLGYFLLLTHYFYSQSIPTGLWLLATATLITATLLRLHDTPRPPRELLSYAALLLAQASPFMLIFFLLFPRVEGPLWGLPQDAYAGLSGLSDRMSPGSLNQLIESGRIAFRVRFADAVPAPAQRYWRGPVLDDYDGRTWKRAAPAQRSSAPPPRVEPGPTLYRYETTLEAHNQRWLLALDLPATLPPESVLSSRMEALSREPLRRRARFALTSTPDAVANREEAAATLRQALALPADDNPRSRALAAEWRKRHGEAAAISAAALRHFRDEPFFYTLRPPLLGQHGVDDFLFGTRRGFCEHYAAAYVFLMRAAGVPARVVTGYQGGEINPIDGYLTVRQSDAHAWAEIWIAGQGWQRIDPTAAVAPSRIERGIEAALPAGETLPALVRIDTDWLRDLRNRWEAANNAWNQWVLGYNPERQSELLSRLGMRDPDWRTLAALLGASSALTLLVIAALTLYRRPRLTPAQQAWRRFCARLAGHGIVRADWEGPLALAARVARERPQLAALCALAAAHFAELQYGRGGTRDAERLRKIEQCTRQLPRKRLPFGRKKV